MIRWQEIAGRIEALDQRLAGAGQAELAAAGEWVAARHAALGTLQDLVEQDPPRGQEALLLRERLEEVLARQTALEQRFRLLRAQLREELARLGRAGYLEHRFAPGPLAPGARMSLRG